MLEKNIVLEILKTIPGTLNVVDADFNILLVGGEIARIFQNTDEIIGKKCYKIFQKREKPCPWCKVATVMKTGKIVNEATAPDDPREKLTGKPMNIYIRPLKDKDGNIVGAIELGTDITHIREANEKRKRAEQALREREAALKVRTGELEEVNSALRVLMKRIDEDKKALEETVSLNVKGLVAPYAERLRKSGLDTKQMAYLNELESHMHDITSQFAHKLSSKYSGLTPTEIQIASLVKDGKTTKQIAELYNLSFRTIESHRQKIRMKIGIKKERASLRSVLLSMQAR